jgi:hypothetical protein
VFGKGANEKSNCDVGRANLNKARWFASTELPASCASGAMCESMRHRESRVRLCKLLYEDLDLEKRWSPWISMVSPVIGREGVECRVCAGWRPTRMSLGGVR